MNSTSPIKKVYQLALNWHDGLVVSCPDSSTGGLWFDFQQGQKFVWWTRSFVILLLVTKKVKTNWSYYLLISVLNKKFIVLLVNCYHLLKVSVKTNEIYGTQSLQLNLFSANWRYEGFLPLLFGSGYSLSITCTLISSRHPPCIIPPT